MASSVIARVGTGGWLVAICSASPLRITLGRFKFPKEEAGLEAREAPLLECFC